MRKYSNNRRRNSDEFIFWNGRLQPTVKALVFYAMFEK